jgi:uncharacterized protein DUF4388
MEQPISPGKVTAALFDLREFLSDLLSPISIAEAVLLLLRCPPELVASEIRVWATAQFKGRADGVPISDYLYHAMEKIRSLGELKIIPAAPLKEYLQQLAQIIVEYCPEEDRHLLLKNLTLYQQAETTLTSSVQIIRRQPGSERPLASMILASRDPAGLTSLGPAMDQLGQGMRRFSLLVERWKRALDTSSGAGATADQQRELMTEILSTVIRQSESSSELEENLAALRENGIDAHVDQIFRALGQQLPDWAIPAGASGGAAAPSASVEAMHRLLALAEDPDEIARHFHEIIKASVEQINDGALGRAATLLELAERITAEKRVNTNFVETIRKTAHKSIDLERVRRLAESPEKQPLLRKVLGFFPEMTVPTLLNEMRSESKRDRRRQLLGLLEIYGPDARGVVLERLRGFVPYGHGDEDGYFQRNLLYLLRRIPRPAPPSEDEEADLVSQLAVHGNTLIVVKEALAGLGGLKHRKAEQTLVSRLADFEAMLLKPEDAPLQRQDALMMLDRTVSALVHQNTRTSLRAVVEHCLKQQPQLGNTLGRLAELGGQDLSVQKDVVRRLIEALDKELPGKLLGWLKHKDEGPALQLIAALSGTPSAEVREELTSIATRFPNEKMGHAAAKAVAAFAMPTARPAEARPAASPDGAPVAEAGPRASGDLELFGLPNLLQTLADSRATAELMLTARDGKPVGVLLLEGGNLLSCQVGTLQGHAAFFQLFEKPTACSFSLRKRPPGSLAQEFDNKPTQAVLPLLLEASRRYDEFHRARTLVPDDTALKPTGVKATAPPNEQDRELLRAVWTRASVGATPLECETQIATDSYRVRRAIAHWVEEGSLQPGTF